VEDKGLLEKEMSLSQKNDFGFDPSRCAELKYVPPSMCFACHGTGRVPYFAANPDEPVSLTSKDVVCSICQGVGYKYNLLGRDTLMNPGVSATYIHEVDYNDLQIAEDKYSKREIGRVSINNRDFYISYEQEIVDNTQGVVVYIWPCAWGWSGRIDGYTFRLFKGKMIYLLEMLLEHCDDLYNFSDNAVYQIKNKPLQ